MAKRLAVTIAGAVSLGSYESGVICEVLDAITQHNANPATTEDERIEIDVLTGASAGGMTAIIMAQKLLFNGAEFIGPYDNPLYNCWVKRIGLAGLQNTGSDELALHSLFSSDLIATISKETLLARYSGAAPAPAQRHPAAAAAIRVGVAMTNLNGVAYGYPVVPSGEFTYIDHGDRLTRFADPAVCDNQKFWEPLRQAAVACGAFPIAFRPQDIQRDATVETDDYPATNMIPWTQNSATFTYSDGGVLQNQPLGTAKDLVDMTDKHLDQENRFYLFVSPHAKDSIADTSFHAADESYVRLVKHLIDVVMGQSGFQDWITAQGVNNKIAELDNRAQGLRDAILAGELDVPALAVTADSLLKLLFPTRIPQPGCPEPGETLAHAQARIAAQYKQEMADLKAPSVEASALRDAILAFETAAGLGERDCMTIYGVTATASELAGAGLQAFLGFFDQKFRDHDYDAGRDHARKVLTDPALGKAGAIGPIRYTGSTIRPIDASLNGLKFSAAPSADIDGFKAALKTRVHQVAKEFLGNVKGVLLEPLTNIGVDVLIDRLKAVD
jgi:hypothetical protein